MKIADISVFVFLFVTLNSTTREQSTQSLGNLSDRRTPAFEVVSIRENTSRDGSMSWRENANGISLGNVQIDLLLRSAYGLSYSNDQQILGLPPWAKNEHFDVEAKLIENGATLFRDLSDNQHSEMLRGVLFDRFRMKAHLETVERPIYALAIAKGGLRLADSKVSRDDKTVLTLATKNDVEPGSFVTSSNEVTANAVSMDTIVSILTSIVGREVMNKTGLTGSYSFVLRFTPNEEAEGSFGTSEEKSAPPTLFTAIQEQLGLRLEATKGPVRIVVVDHIEKPSAN